MDFGLEECTSKTPAGVRCQLKVAELRPTQNAVGFDEVNDKVARYSAKDKDDLKDYLIVHPVPIVIGNGGKFYLTDHHHLANALWVQQGPAPLRRIPLGRLLPYPDYHR